MFLVEYKKGTFVNAELISKINIKDGSVSFTMNGDLETYGVESDLASSFANNVQAINGNIQSIEKAYLENS